MSELDSIDRRILDLLQQDGRLTMTELGERVGLSTSPCSQRVKRLEAQGLVARVHGGVHLKDWGPETSFAQRLLVGPGAKRRVAEAVARLLPDGASLFLDVGSTTAYVAQALRLQGYQLSQAQEAGVAAAFEGIAAIAAVLMQDELPFALEPAPVFLP